MRHSAPVWNCKVAIEIAKDQNGIDQVVLRNPKGASARISLHGGQVCSWRNEQGEELLFTSSKAFLKPPKAMRGGISMCFPQFANCESLEQQGFLKDKIWKFDEDPPPIRSGDIEGASFVDLVYRSSSEEDFHCWPSIFEVRLRVCLQHDGDLILRSRVRNVKGKPITFSFAYHTHLVVSDISKVRIEGLQRLDFLDNLRRKERFTEQCDDVTFESEVDRVYVRTPNAIAVIDHERKRTYVIRKEGLPDVVVWNPWEKRSKAMVDFGDEEYKQMLCVNGAALETRISLRPGEEWTGMLQLTLEPSSFALDL